MQIISLTSNYVTPQIKKKLKKVKNHSADFEPSSLPKANNDK
jgi:hypothetical protein